MRDAGAHQFKRVATDEAVALTIFPADCSADFQPVTQRLGRRREACGGKQLLVIDQLIDADAGRHAPQATIDRCRIDCRGRVACPDEPIYIRRREVERPGSDQLWRPDRIEIVYVDRRASGARDQHRLEEVLVGYLLMNYASSGMLGFILPKAGEHRGDLLGIIVGCDLDDRNRPGQRLTSNQ